MLEQQITTPEQQKWIAKRVGFDYEIVYRPEKENSVADALSRREAGGESSLVALSAPILGVWEEIAAATTKDVELGSSLQQVRDGN